ncbi:hypothetical protein GCM10011507_23120 [Edaphobacter acidisoli]|uniref:C4-type zinc ribbon domain-containing protein n=1 Tax=Edaphobacter acidisoli TaxID=2040573 RepID=A0A916RWY3_9BACT|nr:C4-type zinc ribbon domain-containing protein [Edaphobacter acidisoli]GGA70915.1 hypothetical protein GCM10011507_23120 [Edaphobacter acidisoli]
MHPDLEKLMVLQRHDVELKRLSDEMAALPKMIAEYEAKAKAAEAQKAGVVEAIAKEEMVRRRQESDIKDQQSKIAKVRKQLDMATTTAQVAAFEHEIAFAQAEIGKLEDAELESMERSEMLAAKNMAADEAAVLAEKVLERERAQAAEMIARAKSTLELVQHERTIVRAEIGEDALTLYDRIAKAKGTAVSEGVDQKCSACQMLLRPQRWNDLRDRDNHETMMTCESCGRLLYYDPARDAPQKKAVRSESIAASIVRSL